MTNATPQTTDIAEDGRRRLRHGLFAGKLPDGCSYIAKSLSRFRRGLEDATLAAKGSISLTDAATIQSAMKWLRHSLLCERWLSSEATRLSAAERVSYSREAARASSERDKCIERLGIDKRQSIYDAIYGPATGATR